MPYGRKSLKKQNSDGIVLAKMINTTINFPKVYLELIEILIETYGTFPSRSELVRTAVREFLVREIASHTSFEAFKNQSIKIENLIIQKTVKPDLNLNYNNENPHVLSLSDSHAFIENLVDRRLKGVK